MSGRNGKRNMITMKNKWNRLEEEEKERINLLPYGWMLRNLLQFENTLVAKDALKKVGVKKLLKALNEELEMIDLKEYYVEFRKVKDLESGEEDLVGYLIREND